MVLAEVQLPTRIRTPFSGVVVTKSAQPGEMTRRSRRRRLTLTGRPIVDIDRLVAGRRQRFVHNRSPPSSGDATLNAYPDWKFPVRHSIIRRRRRRLREVPHRTGRRTRDVPDMGVRVAFPTRSRPRPPGPRSGRLGLPTRSAPRSPARRVVLASGKGAAQVPLGKNAAPSARWDRASPATWWWRRPRRG